MPSPKRPGRIPVLQRPRDHNRNTDSTSDRPSLVEIHSGHTHRRGSPHHQYTTATPRPKPLLRPNETLICHSRSSGQPRVLLQHRRTGLHHARRQNPVHDEADSTEHRTNAGESDTLRQSGTTSGKPCVRVNHQSYGSVDKRSERHDPDKNRICGTKRSTIENEPPPVRHVDHHRRDSHHRHSAGRLC